MIRIIEPYHSKALKPGECLLDIETTGLSRSAHAVVMVALLKQSEGFAEFYQWANWNADSASEADLLSELFAAVADDTVITYNGNAFDLPFLTARAQRHGLPFRTPKGFDVFRWLRTRRHCFDFPNLKLKTIEKAAGIARKDALSGSDFVKRFKSLNGDEDRMRLLLGHNREDVLLLDALLPYIYTLRERLSFECRLYDQCYRAEFEQLSRRHDFIALHFQTEPAPRFAIHLTMPYGELNWTGRQLCLTLPVQTGRWHDSALAVAVADAQLGASLRDRSPYALPAPLVTLADDKRCFPENLLPLSEAVTRKLIACIE